MARARRQITYKAQDEAMLPAEFSEAALTFSRLDEQGALEEVGRHVKLRRQGGYSGLDIFLYLLGYFMALPHAGLKGFWEKARAFSKQLGAMASRQKLPSASSVSRALACAETELLREASHHLLLEVSDGLKVLAEPCVQNLDARGRRWHVFDLDPTVTALRQRDLPEDDRLPGARRRAAQTGAPGHTGRKRGELVFRCMSVQHSGSGLWVHGHLSKGNGEGAMDVEQALDSVVKTCKALKHPTSLALVRSDGEFGNVPWVSMCQERGLHQLTRLNRHALYSAPSVVVALKKADWEMVTDSLAGPRRGAADLGTVTLEPGKTTRRPDGGKYEPVRVRLIASRFPKEGQAKRGKVIDGFQIELFITDLPEDGWPAADVLAAYFARSAQENRFAQEDRELGLDHIFSYHLPGQELATLIGLCVWNMRVARGLSLSEPLQDQRVPTLPTEAVAQRRPDRRADPMWPVDPVLTDYLNQVDWDAALADRDNWCFDHSTGRLYCEDGRPLTLSCVEVNPLTDGTIPLIFRRPTGGCHPCPNRPGCFASTRLRASKHLRVLIPGVLADSLRARLEDLRGQSDNFHPELLPPSLPPGPALAQESLFLPTEARRHATQLFEGVSLRVEAQLPLPKPPRPRLLAPDRAHRQHRRKSWEQNVQRYALPPGASVDVQIQGDRSSGALNAWLSGNSPPPEAGAAMAG